MTKFWLTATLAGLVGAVAWLAGQTGTLTGLVLGYLAPLPVFMAGLSLGAAGGAAALAGGAGLVLIAGGLRGAVVFAVTIAAPAVLLVRQALLSRGPADGEADAGGDSGGDSGDGNDAAGVPEWYPAGLLAAWLTGIGMAGLSAMALYLLAGPEGLEGSIDALTREMAVALALPEPEAFIAVVTPLLPGLMAAAWMVMLTLNGALAQIILVKAGRRTRPSPDIAGLTLPGWIAPAGAGAAMVGLLGPGDLGYFGRNMVVVLAVPFFFQGLAVVHALCRRTASGRPLLAIFYVLLILQGWLALPVAILGLAEQLAGFRGRLDKNRDS